MSRRSIPKVGGIFCVALLVIIEIFTIFLMYKSSDNKINSLASVSLKEEINNSEIFAIMLEQSDGTYTESSEWPSSGYTYNASLSGCIDVNGNKLENVLEYTDGIATIDTAKTSYCYLYFSLSPA